MLSVTLIPAISSGRVPPRQTANGPQITHSADDKSEAQKGAAVRPTSPQLLGASPDWPKSQFAAVSALREIGPEPRTEAGVLTLSIAKGWEDWVLWIAQIALAVVGCAGIYYAYRTLKTIGIQVAEMKEQTSLARISADAARLSAQALINSERAWLTVSVAKGRGPGSFMVVVKNRGKTPAKLVRLDSKMDAFVPGDPEHLNIPLDYQCPEVLPDAYFIVKGFRLRHGCYPEKIIEQRRERVSIQNASKFLMLYGRIQYEDVFAADGNGKAILHETCWCYVYDPEFKKFRTGGPARYTRNT